MSSQDSFDLFFKSAQDKIDYLLRQGKGLRWLIDEQLAQLKLMSPRRLIDFACGTGTLALPLALKYPKAEVVGIDLDDDLLAVAQANAQQEGVHNVIFQQADVQDVPLPTASFDAVVGQFFLQYPPEPKRAIHEMVRLVRPGGLVQVCEADPDSVVLHPMPSWRVIRSTLYDLIAAHGGQPYVVQSIYEMFSMAGLIEVDLRPITSVITASNSQGIRNITTHYLDAARKCYDIMKCFQTQQLDEMPPLSHVTAELAFFSEHPGAVYYATYMVVRGKKQDL